MEGKSSAVLYVTRKIVVPSNFTSEDWSRLPTRIRESVFAMSGVTDRQILEKFRDEVAALARGESSESESRLRLRAFLEARGYNPESGHEGTIKDLRTVERMRVALRTNVGMARCWAQWQAQNSSGAIAAFPASRYHRGRVSDAPQDWRSKWEAAIAETTDIGVACGDEMIALLNHPLWTAPPFSRFGLPHPPFNFGSGMMCSPVSRKRSMELGLLPKKGDNSTKAMKLRTMLVPHSQELLPVCEVEIRDAISQYFGYWARWEDGVLIKVLNPAL